MGTTWGTDSVTQCHSVRWRLFWEKWGLHFHASCQQLVTLHPCQDNEEYEREGNLSASVPGTCSVPDVLPSKY